MPFVNIHPERITPGGDQPSPIRSYWLDQLPNVGDTLQIDDMTLTVKRVDTFTPDDTTGVDAYILAGLGDAL
jgi:hypothetical protein